MSENSVTLEISGMSCGGCVGAVKKALAKVPGVERAEVDLAGARAVVAGTAKPEALVAAVKAAGFEARQAG